MKQKRMTHMQRYELTVQQAEQIGDALMPRFRLVIAEERKTTDEKLDRIEDQISMLKARSSFWGGMSGLVAAVATALLTRRT